MLVTYRATESDCATAATYKEMMHMHPPITYLGTNDSEEYVSCTSGEEEEACEQDHETEPVQGPMKVEKSIVRKRSKGPTKSERRELVKMLGIKSLSRLQLVDKQQEYMSLFMTEEARGEKAYDYELLKTLQFLVLRLGKEQRAAKQNADARTAKRQRIAGAGE